MPGNSGPGPGKKAPSTLVRRKRAAVLREVQHRARLSLVGVAGGRSKGGFGGGARNFGQASSAAAGSGSAEASPAESSGQTKRTVSMRGSSVSPRRILLSVVNGTPVFSARAMT